MLKFPIVLVALGGCDYAFGLDEIVETEAPCGPYQSVTEVPIVGVREPRMFSITADAQLAFVFGIDPVGRQRPIPLRWNGGAWEPDPALDNGLVGGGIEGANLAPREPAPVNGKYEGDVQPALMVWLGTSPPELARYFWTGTIWDKDQIQLPLVDPDYYPRAGNVVLVAGTDPQDRVRHTVVTKHPRDPIRNRDQILLHANTPPDFTLFAKPVRTQALNETGLDFGQAVMTENQAVLVYPATRDAHWDIYASLQSPAATREFASGGEVIGINTSDDEIEPWIDATCSKLYFRRVPAGSPNAPGQIFVAE